MPAEKIQPGDWVVWSDYHNVQSDAFRKAIGDSPFQVKEVVGGNIRLHRVKGHVVGHYWGPRFRKDTFITAVKEALKDA